MGIEIEMQEAMGEVNDALREVFVPEDIRCFLLRRAGETPLFEVVSELTNGYRMQWNEFRGQSLLRHATTEPDFRDVLAKTSHVAYGVPDDDDLIEVFVIDDPQRDVIDPDGSTPFWKVFVSKLQQERFTLPPPPPAWILQRTIEGSFLSLLLGSSIVGVADANFTSADIGRRLVIEDAIDGVIQTINSSEQVVLDAFATATPFFATVLIYDPA